MKYILNSYLVAFLFAAFSFGTLSAQIKWSKVEAGSFSSIALRSDGTLWSWGFNVNGQLGLGNTQTKNSPTQLGADKDWSDISMGGFHCVALKNDGTMWAWGLNGNGQAGQGNTTGQFNAPQQIGTDSNWTKITT